MPLPLPLQSRTFVHRIQDADGLGPFRPGLTLRWFQGRSEEEEEHLQTFDLRLLGPIARALPASMRFAAHGCRTKEQLRRWFLPQEYNMLRGLGFRAVTIEVDAILMENPVQVLFARHLPLQHSATKFELYPA